ncbi:MFS transporter [Thermocatellispora tengchongensis]|uniref:MFS transporter n=1 Tax=Thermocatellispora tengchongensis TaxID=1073253 RepID=UPI00363D5B60
MLSIVGVIAVIYAIKEAATAGVWQTSVLTAAAIGVAALVVFAFRQVRLPEPLIDVRLFRRRAFSAAVGANLIAIFGMSALSLVFAWYFQLVLGWSPLQAGLASIPGGLAAAVGGVLSTKLIATWGRSWTVATGLTLSAISFACYSQLATGTPYAFVLTAMLIGGLGIGLTFAVTNDTVLASVPRERAGAAAAISETAFELGGALGIAILGSILSGVYRAHLTLPRTCPPPSSPRYASHCPPPWRRPPPSPPTWPRRSWPRRRAPSSTPSASPP